MAGPIGVSTKDSVRFYRAAPDLPYGAWGRDRCEAYIFMSASHRMPLEPISASATGNGLSCSRIAPQEH